MALRGTQYDQGVWLKIFLLHTTVRRKNTRYYVICLDRCRSNTEKYKHLMFSATFFIVVALFWLIWKKKLWHKTFNLYFVEKTRMRNVTLSLSLSLYIYLYIYIYIYIYIYGVSIFRTTAVVFNNAIKFINGPL